MKQSLTNFIKTERNFKWRSIASWPEVGCDNFDMGGSIEDFCIILQNYNVVRDLLVRIVKLWLQIDSLSCYEEEQ